MPEFIYYQSEAYRATKTGSKPLHMLMSHETMSCYTVSNCYLCHPISPSSGPAVIRRHAPVDLRVPPGSRSGGGTSPALDNSVYLSSLFSLQLYTVKPYSTMSSKNVVFDVVGTLVGYDHLFAAIDHQLGERLRAEGIKPSLLGYTWIEVAEREYTYLSMSGKYTVFADVFRALFYRMLWMAGISEPREFASEKDLEYIMEQYAGLTMRPGAAECVQKLRDAGFRVWCFTAGDIKRVGGYFARAGIEMPAEDLLSCDSAGVGKPDPAAYRPLLDKLVAENGGKVPWFAAGHMWDVSAARRAGYVFYEYGSLW